MKYKAKVMIEVDVESRDPIPEDELYALAINAASARSIGGASVHYGWYRAKRGKQEVISVREYFKR